MQTLLSKAVVASVTVAGLGLLAAPQAQAASFSDPATFFAGGTLSTTNFTATGFSFTGTGTPVVPSFVGLEEESSSEVSFVLNVFPAINAPATFTYSYTLTSLGDAFEVASANLNPVPAAGTVALLTKNIYADSTKAVFLGSATLDQNLTVSTSTVLDGIPAGYTSIFVEDVVTLTSGGVTSLTNSYQVPEPLTMLGASAAIAFGAAFKRRNANKG